jgi:hypothetical protein
MKKYCGIWVALFLGVMTVQGYAQKHCPVNFTSQTLADIQRNPDDWYGKIAACNGTIEQVVPGYNKKPYYLIALNDGGKLWVSGQVESGYETIGSNIRVLGFFEKTVRQYMPAKVNRDGYHLIAFVIYDLDQNQLAMRPGQESIVQQWLDGKIPNPGKRPWQD